MSTLIAHLSLPEMKKKKEGKEEKEEKEEQEDDDDDDDDDDFQWLYNTFGMGCTVAETLAHHFVEGGYQFSFR